MKILLTGKNGQLGYELERSLQCAGEIVALDKSALDLSQLDDVRHVIRTVRPQLIINAAAYTAVDQAEQNEEAAHRINAHAPEIIAQEAKIQGAALIHYSTDYVFDGAKEQPYLESDVPRPINIYGRSKLAGEQAIANAGIPYLIFRTSWVYGTRGHNFLQTILRLAKERDELRVVANQHGAPTWCRLIAQATSHAITQLGVEKNGVLSDRWQRHAGLYHLSAQGVTTWHEFAQEIVRATKGHRNPTVIPIATQEYPLPARRPLYSVLSSQRFIDTFCALPHWRKALELCLA